MACSLGGVGRIRKVGSYLRIDEIEGQELRLRVAC
jgi:hypothetical protein